MLLNILVFFFFSSRRRHTRLVSDWSSDVCSSDLQHLAAKQNLSGSTIPSIPNQVGGAHRDQGHGRQAGPLGLPHAALRDEIRGPRSSLLRASTPRVTDQAPQGQSRKARIPSHPNTGGGLTRRSFWRGNTGLGPSQTR